MTWDEVAVPFTSRGDEVGDELEKENARGGWVKSAGYTYIIIA